MKHLNRVLLIISLIVAASCGSKVKKHADHNSAIAHIVPEYATQFEIFEMPWGYKISIKDPWKKGHYFGQYAVVRPNKKVPTEIFDAVIKQPINSIAALSSTHIGLLARLGCDSLIKGSLSAHGVCHPKLRKRYQKGDFINLGEAMNPNIESIINLQPQLITKSAFQDVQKSDGLLLRAGSAVVYTAEWMETSMLGRAEWIRFYGYLLGKEHEADSIFNEIKSEYLAVKNKAQECTVPTYVLPGMPFKNTWHMSGGKSYRGQLFKDAAANYFYANDSTTGSIPLNIETVLNHQLNSDIWVDINVDSKEELLGIDSRFSNFKAFKNNRLFSMRNRVTPEGNNDYWESGIAHPEILLKDMVKIVHPEVLPSYTLYYYKQLD